MSKKRTCDRCGKPCDPLKRSALLLLQTKPDIVDFKTRSHEFDLCDDCARAVFRFIGEGAEK
jgi:hypothetical protein